MIYLYVQTLFETRWKAKHQIIQINSFTEREIFKDVRLLINLIISILGNANMVSSIKFNEIDKLSDKLNKAKLAILFKLMVSLYACITKDLE